jgi:hypothetical protein
LLPGRLVKCGEAEISRLSHFGGDDIPLFLLTVFGKGEKGNLSQAERNALRALTATLRESLTRKG